MRALRLWVNGHLRLPDADEVARFFRLRWLRQARLTTLLVRTKTLSRW